MGRPGEFELIERYFALLASAGSFGMKDDAALLEIPAGRALVVTCDSLAAGVHFFHDDRPDLIARKALRVNLSDLAAKGAEPVGFSLSLGLHEVWDEPWLSSFAEGLATDCRFYDISLVGGDTFRVERGPVVSITAYGQIEPGCYASRLSAAPGHILCVTGTIGEAALGLAAVRGELRLDDKAAHDRLVSQLRLPEPPVAFAGAIAQFATAAMDISDGFVGDIGKLAAASSVDFEIDKAAVPLPAVLDGLEERWTETALTGGDDYQIAFTVADEDDLASARAHGARNGIRVSRLAQAQAGSGKVSVLDGGRGLEFPTRSYTHFGAGEHS